MYGRIIQFILACIMFLCAVAEFVAHTVMGAIYSMPEFIVAGILVLLSWEMVAISWKELKEESK